MLQPVHQQRLDEIVSDMRQNFETEDDIRIRSEAYKQTYDTQQFAPEVVDPLQPPAVPSPVSQPGLPDPAPTQDFTPLTTSETYLYIVPPQSHSNFQSNVLSFLDMAVSLPNLFPAIFSRLRVFIYTFLFFFFTRCALYFFWLKLLIIFE